MTIHTPNLAGRTLVFLLFLIAMPCACAHKLNEPGNKKLLYAKALDEAKEIRRDKTPPTLEAPSIEIPVGEKLEYIFDCFGIAAARMIIETKEPITMNGKKCHHITAVAFPRKLFSIFYNVRYDVETYIEQDTRRPVLFHKRKTRGRTVTEETINFDYQTNTAFWKYTGGHTAAIPLTPNAQDLLSMVYYFRTLDIKTGYDYPIDVIYNGRAWPTTMRVGKIRPMKIRGRRLNIFPIEPLTGLTQHVTGEQKIVIYATAGKERLPVIFKIHSKVSPLIGVIRRFPATKP